MSGAGKLFGFTGTAGMMEAVGFPVSSLFLVGAILLGVGGGVLLLVGHKAWWASLAPVAFLGAATVLFRAANLADPLQGQKQMTHVLKNLAILGALVKFAPDGAAAYALDNLRCGKAALEGGLASLLQART